MQKYSFQIAWSQEDSAYVAESHEFPDLSGLGDSPEEAVQELRVAIDLALETLLQDGSVPPEPQLATTFSGQFRLRLPKSLHKALATRSSQEGVSLNTLAVTYLAEALAYTAVQSQAANHYAQVLNDWLNVMQQLKTTMVRFDQARSETTDIVGSSGQFQDPTLRQLYGGDQAVVFGLKE